MHNEILTEQEDFAYPRVLKERLGNNAPRSFYSMGNLDILENWRLGLLCSICCPGSVIIKTFDAIRELRDAGMIVIGGFHSPMERESLDLLLRGSQPVILCPARSLVGLRIGEAGRRALKEGRLLILSLFGPDIRRTISVQTTERNKFVAAMADVVFIPHASPGGKTEAVAYRAIERGQIVVTFDDKENNNLIKAGAKIYEYCKDVSNANSGRTTFLC